MKKTITKILCTALCASMLSIPALSETSVSDWAKESVEQALSSGITTEALIIQNPQKAITRKKFSALAFNCIKNAPTIVNFKESEKSSPFTDTDDPAITKLYEIGIISGKSETSFAPEDFLTREEAATILLRMADYLGIDIPDKEYTYNDKIYTDGIDISVWALSAVCNAKELGIMNGVSDTHFAPQDTYTAEQAITTIMRLYNMIPERSVNTFSAKLNRYMPDDENYMFSPFSIKSAFALAANGAEGETQSEILDVIGIDNLDDFNEKSKSMIETYSNCDVAKLNIANSIWINSSKTSWRFSDNYKNKVSQYYNGISSTVNDNNAVEEINSWVDKQTNGKIPTIINNSEFFAILVNAVYFKAEWENEFNEHATWEGDFTERNGTKKETDFMNMVAYLNYCDENGIRMVEMPYKTIISETEENDSIINTSISMYVALTDNDTIDMEEYIYDNLKKGNFKNTFIDLSLPKFEMNFLAKDVDTALIELGIKKAFSSEAQFSPMLNKGHVFLSDVLHKTYIKVDEKGTEAAAVTALPAPGGGMGTPIQLPEPIIFNADKPFTFVIYDNTNNEVLFMGEYAYVK